MWQGPKLTRRFGGVNQSQLRKPIIMAITPIMDLRVNSGKRRCQLIVLNLMILGFIMYMVMFGNGSKIVGIRAIMVLLITARPGQRVVNAPHAFCGAAPGAAFHMSSVRPIATGSSQTTGAAISGFEFPERLHDSGADA